MAITIRQMTNGDPGFYAALGPFLACKDVHKTIGGVPWDEPAKTWLVAREGEKVVGFLALNEGAKRSLLESGYTVPGHERIRARLVKEAVKRWGHDRDLHTTVRSELVPHYSEAGFAPVKETVHMTTLVRRADVRG